MALNLFHKVFIVAVVIAVVQAGGTENAASASKPADTTDKTADSTDKTAASTDTTGALTKTMSGVNAEQLMPDYGPPNEMMITAMDKLGLSKKAREPLKPIYIPTDLTNVPDKQLIAYNRALYNQRRLIQNRMTRYIVYKILTVVLLQLFGSVHAVKAFGATFYWVNNGWRFTINGDMAVHQRQLNEYIIEYARVKNIDLTKTETNWRSNTRVIKLYVDEAKTHEVLFPFYITKKRIPIPDAADIRYWIPFARNWLLK
ncbi:uncharacterized protein LOC129005377 [Macrosteles quadrilineatus]|uniref:uncharacterized protein LOC129005377 n=1 Tax=Macrosteles quadrilineatus TaxID=74068 RepID=UPI0023E321D1|nr:uncharacterized protein LOC129005377 [Macrosteles quadrilineatus]